MHQYAGKLYRIHIYTEVNVLIKGIDISKISTPDVNFDELESRIKTGNAVLITGAGFSLKCQNISGSYPPMAKQLSHIFSQYLNIENSDDLKYTSDMSMKYGDRSDILEILRQQYFLIETSDANKKICSIPWRRVYTTNYDNSVELAYLYNNKNIDSISLFDKTSDYIKNNKQVCVHINGSIQNAIEDDLDSKIKLTDSSYLSGDFFLSTEWRSIFNKDLDHCNAIVFVGYSLYDADITKILHDNPKLAEKTYFITHKEADYQQTYKLSNYGHVCKIGTEGFGEFISKIRYEEEPDLMPECFSRVEVSSENVNLDDFETKSLLLYGKYETKNIDMAIRNNFTIPYMFRRSVMEDICSNIKARKHIFIQSELGNGKSVLINQIASSLSSEGLTVWKLTNFDNDPCKDLSILASYGQHILIIDDVSEQYDFFKYYSALLPNNITLLMTDRTLNLFGNIKILNDANVDVDVYTLDKLSEEEKIEIIDIFEDQNLWKQYTGWPLQRKLDLLRDTYKDQLSNVLIGILNSPDIKGRVAVLLSNLLDNQSYKKTLFAICLCDIFGIRKESSYIADIAGNEDILKAIFRNEEAFKSLFLIGNDNSIISKSSILCLFIINSYFSESYIVEHCLEIMKRIDNSDLDHLRKLHARLRTFHNVEKLIPQKQNALNNYFVQLKRNCTWLREHPHYWVQYAMCRLSFGDTSDAQLHLTSAYKFASKRPNGCHTENIDTQQARLYLIESVNLSNNFSTITQSYKLFEKAHFLLSAIADDEHKYRQVIKYEDIYHSLYNKLAKGKQADFEHFCRAMLKGALALKETALPTQRIRFLNMSISILTKITDEISEKRNG